MQHQDGTYSLAGLVDEYLIQRQINKKKYFASYLVGAKWAWKKLFQQTIFSVQSEWLPLKKGEPYNYVEMPKGTVRFFNAALNDDCGNIVPLYYNERLNILKKPTVKKCACAGSCDCGCLCDELNTLIKTSRTLFTITNVDYDEITYLKVCKNGDVIEYREIPTKKYNDFIGDGGDYNNDYNNDYNINPMSDFDIVTEIRQTTLCKLDVKPCGCPDETDNNINLVHSFCGCYLPCWGKYYKKHCDRSLGDINSNCRGEVKVSECGNKIYYKPQRTFHGKHFDGKKANLPDYILVNYQTSGENCNSAVAVPEYACEAMFAGIHHYSIRFNNMYNLSEKQEARYRFTDEENKLIMFLNPFNLEVLANIQDAVIRY